MPTWVALLRAVNVGGRNKVPMADLRRVVEALPATDVRTYVQSGNVVFRSPVRSEPALVDALAAALRDAFGFAIGVIVRDAAGLAAALAGNPLLGEGRDATHLALTFLSATPTVGTLAPGIQRLGDEEYALVGRELYLYAPDGLGRSKLGPVLAERKLGVRGTTRNWRSVTALAALAADATGSGPAGRLSGPG